MRLSRVIEARRVTLRRVRIDEVDELAMTLPGVRRTGPPGERKWLVGARLVAREDGPGLLVVRIGFADRERLLAQHPETFGVPPHFEQHQKVQVDLAGDEQAIREAIQLAWRLQVQG
jgi:hypothetical protein